MRLRPSSPGGFGGGHHCHGRKRLCEGCGGTAGRLSTCVNRCGLRAVSVSQQRQCFFPVAASDVRGGLAAGWSVSRPSRESSRWVLRAALADGSWVELPTALPDSLGCEQIAVLPLRFIDDLSCRRSGTLLEIGGRARSTPSSYRPLTPPGWRYVSFDIVDGPDVDVVGDAHELSSYFDAGSIDAIVSASVFEHLATPWKAVLEMNRVLAPGGTVLTTTHQAWPLHEQPWDFWRYSDASWHALFNESTGFRLDQAAMGQPADMVARIMNGATAGLPGQPAFLGSAALATKIGDTTLTWPVPTSLAAPGTYPG